MLTKFKQKFGKNLGKGIVFAAGLFLAILAFYGLSANKALADATCNTNQGASQLCDLSQIKLNLNILVDGKPGNFVRAASSSGSSFKFEVQGTLISPSSLTLGATQVNGSGIPMTLEGFESVAFPSTPFSASNSSNPCVLTKLFNNLFSSGFLITTCNNPPFTALQDANSVTATSFKQGDILFDYTFIANSADYGKLGLIQVNNGTDPNSGINLVYVRDGLELVKTAGNAPGDFTPYYNTFNSNGNGLYVQLYKTPDQVLAANTAGPPTVCPPDQSPVAGQAITCVPGYGSTSGSGTNPTKAPGGGTLVDLVNSVVGYVAAIINQLIYFIFYWLIAPLIQAVLSIHVYTDTFVNVIYPGWEIVRNVCNILFIVAIIAMGMATLLRVESYQWRHMLVQLVIAALLVNFSLIIGQVILALADTIQSQFLPNNVDVIRSLAQNLMVANSSSQLSKLYLANSIAPAIQYLFFVAMAIGSFIVFGAIAVFLVIRVVVLWVLLMLSPVAYVARILPSTKNVAKTWWDNFIKYAFFTPIIAFFLNMTAVISAATLKNSVLQNLTNTSSFPGSNSPNLTAFVFTVASNILLLVFLILAIKVASYMGVVGGGVLSDIGEKGIKWPFQTAGKAVSKPVQATGQRLGEAANLQRLKLANKIAPEATDTGLKKLSKRIGLGVLAPGAVSAARKEERQHNIKEEKELLGKRAQDVVEPGHKAAEKLLLQRENEKVKKARDTYENASEADVVSNLRHAINDGDIVEFKALMKVATDENYLKAVATGIGGGNIDDVYRQMDAKAKAGDKAKVDQTRKQIDKNEADKGRYQNMSNIATTGPGTGARDQKLNSLSIEDMAKVDKDLYMTGGAALTGTSTTVLREIVTAMGSDPDVAKDMIKQLKKKEKTALRTLLGARGAAVTVPAGVNAADAAAAKTHFDTYVP